MTTQTTDPVIGRLRAQSDNRNAFEAMQNYMALPAPTFVARHDVVYVSVADADDLLPWLSELGGEIHRSAEFEGVQLWTLHTFTPPTGDGSRIPIRVSVPLPMGESVMPELLEAVAR